MAVKTFSAFDNANDPHREHDFGALDIDGHKIFFKIDYYEKGTSYGAGAEHPEDTSTTDRVLI